MRAALVAPLDEADAEVLDAVREQRRVDLERAFPEPPPPARERVDEDGFPIPETEEEAEANRMPPPVQPVANSEVLRRRNPVRMGTPEPPPPPAPAAEDGPAQRLANVGRHSPAYQKEFQYRLVHRMLLRNLPLDTIAAQLGISTQSVLRIRHDLNRRLSHEAQTINRYEIAGKTLAFYDEIQGMALRVADEPQARAYTRLQALQTALAAQADRQRFLTASGFWGAAPFQPKDAMEDDSSRAANKIQTLIEMVIDNKGDTVIDEQTMDEVDRQTQDDGKVDLL
jgi:hypothetical protein